MEGIGVIIYIIIIACFVIFSPALGHKMASTKGDDPESLSRVKIPRSRIDVKPRLERVLDGEGVKPRLMRMTEDDDSDENADSQKGEMIIAESFDSAPGKKKVVEKTHNHKGEVISAMSEMEDRKNDWLARQIREENRHKPKL